MQKSRFTAKQESAAAAFKNVLISWRERKIEIFYTTNAAEPRQKKNQDGQYPTTTTIFSRKYFLLDFFEIDKIFLCVLEGSLEFMLTRSQ